MFQFNEEEFCNILKEVYERGYHGYLDLCPLVVDEYLEKHRKPECKIISPTFVPADLVWTSTPHEISDLSGLSGTITPTITSTSGTIIQ